MSNVCRVTTTPDSGVRGMKTRGQGRALQAYEAPASWLSGGQYALSLGWSPTRKVSKPALPQISAQISRVHPLFPCLLGSRHATSTGLSPLTVCKVWPSEGPALV